MMSAVLDSACTSNVTGERWLQCYIDSLDDKDREQIVYSEGSKMFKFGGGEKLPSIQKVVIPAVLADKAIKIETDVVQSDIPLLLSLSSMKKAGLKLDLENDEAEVFNKKIALDYTPSGHYCVPLYKSDKTVEVKVLMFMKKWRIVDNMLEHLQPLLSPCLKPKLSMRE